MSAQIFTGTIIAKADCTLLARVTDMAGTSLIQSDLSSISWTTLNANTQPMSTVSSGTFTIASVVYNTLQTPSFWTVDTTGYNFAGALAYTAFATNCDYRAEVKFTLTSGVVIRGIWEAIHIPIYGS